MANGDPTGSAICSVTLNVPEDNIQTTVALDSSANLESGKQYAIIVSSTGLDSSNYVWWSQYVGDGYAGGLRLYSTDSGSSWSQASTRDMYFGLYSGENLKDYFNGTGSTLDIYGNIYIGQSITPSSSYEVTHIELALGKSGSPNGTVTFAIYKVVGETYTEAPTKAINPTPSNATDNVTLDQQTVTWENGGGATSYNVYYGTESGNLSLLESGVTDTSYTIFNITNGSPFDYTVTRYWRIDAVNVAGTTTGDEWSFTTITFSAPPPGLRGYDSSGGGEGGFAGGAIGDGQMNIKIRLVAFARNKVFYEDT